MGVARFALAGALALGLALAAESQDQKKDAAKDKLVGLWEVTKGETKGLSAQKEGTRWRFSEDGKLTITIKFKLEDKERDATLEGAYAVSGPTLTMKLRQGAKEQVVKAKVVRVDDKELVLEAMNRKATTLKRVGGRGKEDKGKDER